MSRSSSEERWRPPKCPFEVYRAEGDSLLAKKNYKKAIVAYDKALELKEQDRHCLLRRSTCHLAIGNLKSALEDAEASLNDNSDYYKGLYLKAQILYSKGAFEQALMHFHRGHQQRPELQMFRLGIQKCEEAIRNSLTNTKVLPLSLEGARSFTKQMEDRNQKRYIGQKSKEDKTENQDHTLAGLPKDKTRILSGPLYNDQQYLENLLNQEAIEKWRTKCSEEVRNLAKEELDYLNGRLLFWHQEKPFYARTKSKKIKSGTKSMNKEKQSVTICKVLETLHKIDRFQHNNEHPIAIKTADHLRKEVESWTQKQFNNRLEVLANLQSMLGLSYLEMSQYDKALDAYKEACRLAEECNLPEIISHATDNMGRVYARRGQYKKAIDVWEKKLQKCTDELDILWLRYELGRCYLEIDQSQQALEHGSEALKLATDIEDESWKLNTLVLIGQANLVLKNRDAAQDAFTRAHEIAKELHAESAEKAIADVLDEIQNTEREYESESFTQSDMKHDQPTLKTFGKSENENSDHSGEINASA